MLFACEDLKRFVKEPQWPDPNKEDLPPPLIHSIQKRPPQRHDRETIVNFSIWTPLAEESSRPISQEGANAEPTDDKPKLHDKATRWVLQPKESKTLYVKFYSTKTGVFKQDL